MGVRWHVSYRACGVIHQAGQPFKTSCIEGFVRGFEGQAQVHQSTRKVASILSTIHASRFYFCQPPPYLSVQPQCPGTVFLAINTASSPWRSFMVAASDSLAALIAGPYSSPGRGCAPLFTTKVSNFSRVPLSAKTVQRVLSAVVPFLSLHCTVPKGEVRTSRKSFRMNRNLSLPPHADHSSSNWLTEMGLARRTDANVVVERRVRLSPCLLYTSPSPRD